MKEIKVEEAASWTDEEAANNVQYLRDRLRYAEADKVLELRGDGAETDTSDDGEQAQPSDDEVPDGTVDEVLDWVGDDEDRAKRALEAERTKDNPRKGIIEELEVFIS